ncbi:MAG TPA: hypothetical protein VH741_00300 [Candidatus Limnocylindrales bacterium]|jgi:hypothetical protein
MAREKATITLDRQKAAAAQALAGDRPLSEVIDIALDEYVRLQELRHDIGAYQRRPPTAEEIALGEIEVEFDLADDDVDYEALYGSEQ